MAVIDYKAINMNALKAKCKALNESGLLPEPIEIRVGLKKQDLADAFVAGIEQCNDIGKLDDVPEDVYTYYTGIVKPGGEDTPGTTAAPAETPAATPGGGRGKAAPAAKKPAAKKPAAKKPAAKKPAAPKAPAEPRVTRATVFAGIISDGTARTKKQLVDEMQAQYQGSEKEAAFWVNGYCSVLLALGKLTKEADGTLVYAG